MKILGSPLSRALGGAGFGSGAGGLASLQSLITALSPIAYWPLGEVSGTTATDILGGFNGAYAGTYTLGQAGFGDGSPAALLTNGRVSLAASLAALDTPFNPALGSLVAACKAPSAAMWTDGAYHFAVQIGADTNNRVILVKPDTNNTISGFYVAGGTFEIINYTTSTLNWMLLAITWSVAAGQVRFYVNGTLIDTSTGLGTWSGALASNTSAIGSTDSGLQNAPWAGWISHVALWNTVLTPAQIELLSPASYFAE